MTSGSGPCRPAQTGRSRIDLVLEGEAARGAGPPPWHLYRFRFHTVFGVATAEPYGASRWRFER